jgi:predicted PhzF superfamily epimerase YddE/YHI9
MFAPLSGILEDPATGAGMGLAALLASIAPAHGAHADILQGVEIGARVS